MSSKKSLVVPKKHSQKMSAAHLGKKTEWSYFMQAIEPNSPEINEAFPGYHPMWIIRSQDARVCGGQFKYMREHMLKITVEQCAAWLRVHRTTIGRWESGKGEVSFLIFELLRSVCESVHFRLSHKGWQGWFIGRDGRLVSPDRGGLSFSPDELSFIRETHQVKSMYERENKLLRDEIEPLRAEIAKLRAGADHDGLLDELKAIEARLAKLAAHISNNKVVRIGKRNTESAARAKAA